MSQACPQPIRSLEQVQGNCPIFPSALAPTCEHPPLPMKPLKGCSPLLPLEWYPPQENPCLCSPNIAKPLPHGSTPTQMPLCNLGYQEDKLESYLKKFYTNLCILSAQTQGTRNRRQHATPSLNLGSPLLQSP